MCTGHINYFGIIQSLRKKGKFRHLANDRGARYHSKKVQRAIAANRASGEELGGVWICQGLGVHKLTSDVKLQFALSKE